MQETKNIQTISKAKMLLNFPSYIPSQLLQLSEPIKSSLMLYNPKHA